MSPEDDLNLEALASHLVNQTTSMMKELVRQRAIKNIAVEDVAARMAVDVDTVKRMERYDSDPTLSQVNRYALAIGASVTHAVSDWDDVVMLRNRMNSVIDPVCTNNDSCRVEGHMEWVQTGAVTWEGEPYWVNQHIHLPD